MRRVQVEAGKGGLRAVVEKAERSDVVGNEERLLSGAEKEALGRWREVERRVWGQVARLDELVACLRDFAPLDDARVGMAWRAEGEEE